MLKYVVDAVKDTGAEVVVVTASKEQADSYAKIVSPKVRLVCSADESKGILGAALTGFEAERENTRWFCRLTPHLSPKM